MNSIAWAIVYAGILMMHPRDRTEEFYSANNLVDIITFTVSFGMLTYFSFKS